MKTLNSQKIIYNNIVQVSDYILEQQHESGAIPWFKNGKLDPWDHCEAIMALSIQKEFTAAIRAFTWLQENQNINGSWFAKYYGEPDDDLDRAKIESNFVAYPATALWHFYLCSQDIQTITMFFPMIQNAIDFVIKLQTSEGDIQWAVSDKEALPKDALLTASSSILRSLECALLLAERLEIPCPHWQIAYEKLHNTIRNKPWRFDRTWESKARFSMDWFYPILSGAFTQAESNKRLKQHWDKFIVPDLGCKCVADEPWVTIAETCELIIALHACGDTLNAKKMLDNLQQWQDEDGGFWTGYVYKDKTIWPKEKTTWTAAAIALASDALYAISPAHNLFTASCSLEFSRNT